MGLFAWAQLGASCAGLTWGLSRSCDKMMPGGGVTQGLLGPEDRWPLLVTSRLSLPTWLPCTMSPCGLAAEKPAFLHEDSGLPRVTAEAFPGLSRRLAQTHFYCFLTVKRSWASQGREINVMQRRRGQLRILAISPPEGPYLGLAWKEEGVAAILSDTHLVACGCQLPRTRSQNYRPLLLPPLFTDLDRQRGWWSHR